MDWGIRYLSYCSLLKACKKYCKLYIIIDDIGSVQTHRRHEQCRDCGSEGLQRRLGHCKSNNHEKQLCYATKL